MGYLIAVGSSDEINVNLKFGEADEVLIYEVEGTGYSLKEKRKLNIDAKTEGAGQDKIKSNGISSEEAGQDNSDSEKAKPGKENPAADSDNSKTGEAVTSCSAESCKSCNCSGSGHGCNGGSDAEEKVKILSDCRCVLFKKVGFQAQKQFEKKAISIFDIECEISDAFEKITKYYEKVDSHKSLRK